MKRSPLQRKTPLQRSGRVKPKRATPRRREAPRWTWEEWGHAGTLLASRAEGACERCATTWGQFERHHRQRRRDGGDRLSNLLLLCTDCHRWVTEHPKESRQAGWIVSMSRNPTHIPVLWRRRSWFLLDDDGGKRPAYVMRDAHE